MIVADPPFYVTPAVVASVIRRDGLNLRFGSRTVSTKILTANCRGQGHGIAGQYSRFSCVITTPHDRSTVIVTVTGRNLSSWTWSWKFP